MLRARFYQGPNFAFAYLSLGPLVGECLSQTLHHFADAKAISIKGGFNLTRNYNTPKRSHIVKTRLDDEELADFQHRLELYGMNQSEFIRQAISGVTIRPIITVSPVNDELLSATES